MSDDQLKTATVPILHFPTVLGAAIPSYNLPGVQGDLNFTPMRFLEFSSEDHKVE